MGQRITIIVTRFQPWYIRTYVYVVGMHCMYAIVCMFLGTYAGKYVCMHVHTYA